jgi:ATP-dependent Lon protease
VDNTYGGGFRVANKTLKNIPLLPLRGLLVYPTMVLHIDVGRERSVFAIEHAIAQDNLIFLATQKEISNESPEPDDLFSIGTLANVKSLT